ncbi:hypothetical protein TcCL_Unassigned01519 [Trypanosoma cruzi]|nr:hypothetical protein TcCL_Unassigned01519 [Trypanosoma cruzi]
MPSDRHIPGNASYLSGELLLVEVPKMNYGSGLTFVQHRAKTAWEWLRHGLCSLRRRCDRCAVSRSRPRSSAGRWFRWDFWRLRLTAKAKFPQRLGARNAMGVNHVRHDTSAAATVLAAHRAVCRASDRGGVGSSGRRWLFRAKFFACLLCGIRAAPTACAWDGGLQWS